MAKNNIATATGRRIERLESDTYSRLPLGPDRPAYPLLERDERNGKAVLSIDELPLCCRRLINDLLQSSELHHALAVLLSSQFNASPA
jgi:hypothetical protein